MPIFGAADQQVRHRALARTLSTMFAAGVPLVEALDSVGGASGNTSTRWPPRRSRRRYPPVHALTVSMQNATGVFPNMVLQMAAIGEESGSLDHMLGKAAEFYEARSTKWSRACRA
jgi:type IV pilus assembly protein PilC